MTSAGKPEKNSLESVGQGLEAMQARVENWEELSPTLVRRIEEDARIQASIRAKDPNFMKSEADAMRPIEWGYVMRPPQVSQEIRELGESDIFRPVATASNPGTFTSGREVQVIADKSFRWTPETLDRIEDDITRFYLDGEINA